MNTHTNPGVTPADIEASIVEEHYFNGNAALDAARFNWLCEDHASHGEREAVRDRLDSIGTSSAASTRRDIDAAMGRDGNLWSPSLAMLTFCVLVTHNGHTVTGEAHCQDPAKFDAETGRQAARANAIDKLWPMVVFSARQRALDLAVQP